MEKNRYKKIQTQIKGGLTTCRTSQKNDILKREKLFHVYIN